jgi:hypothetical protein
MRREKKEADRKRKTELMEAFAKYLSATPWLGPETHWRNAEDRIRQEFAEYNILVEIGADCRTVFEKACEDKRREVDACVGFGGPCLSTNLGNFLGARA